MTQYLPHNLLALFAARDPIPYLAPIDKLTHEKKRQPYLGVAEFLQHFEDPEETPPAVKGETKQERLIRKRREKAEQNAYKLEQDLALWNPASHKNSTHDPYKTLFVARINYETSESKLRREFEAYGKIRQIKLVNDVKTGSFRGYAFIEYEEEADMHLAYKKADGKKIDGRRVVVDVERGRTVKGWIPRRLGGGKGGRKSHMDPSLVEGGGSGTRTGRGGSIDKCVDDRIRDRERERDRGGADRERDRDRGGERRRSKERGGGGAGAGATHSRSRSREKDRKKRSKSRERHRSRSKDRGAKKSRRSRSRDRAFNASQSGGAERAATAGGSIISGSNSSSTLKKESSRKERSRSRERTRKGDDQHFVGNNPSNGNGNGNYRNGSTESGDFNNSSAKY